MDYLKHLIQSCLNFKVIGVVAILIALAYLFAPQLMQYSWLLIVLICPLSMILMMVAMRRADSKDSQKEVSE